MNILVTGGKGYIASVLIPMLEEQGHDVIPYDLPDDIRDIKHLVGYDVVVHLAATFDESEPLSRTINYEEAVRLASLARKDHVDMFVFTSTCGVLNKNDGTNYTRYKGLAEHAIVKRYAYTVLRLGSVYGHAPVFSTTPLVNRLVSNAVQCGHAEIFGSNEYRPVIHVSDVVQAIRIVLAYRIRGLYNAVTENVTKMRVLQVIHENLPNVKADIIPTDGIGYTAECSTTLSKHGFKQTMTLEQGIKEMIDARNLG